MRDNLIFYCCWQEITFSFKMSTSSQESAPEIYHEKQVKALCALHALNNVLQEKRFTKEDLDDMCNQLAPGTWFWNSHRSVLGIGNYDVNVIMSALEKCQKELVWFDKRKDPEDIMNIANIYGFILNIRTEWRYSSWFNLMKKHWIALKAFNGNYYELDSKRSEGPELIGKAPELYAHLRRQLDLPETELFLVLEKNVAESVGWKRANIEDNESNVSHSTQGIEDVLNVIDLNKSDVRD